MSIQFFLEKGQKRPKTLLRPQRKAKRQKIGILTLNYQFYSTCYRLPFSTLLKCMLYFCIFSYWSLLFKHQISFLTIVKISWYLDFGELCNSHAESDEDFEQQSESEDEDVVVEDQKKSVTKSMWNVQFIFVGHSELSSRMKYFSELYQELTVVNYLEIFLEA